MIKSALKAFKDGEIILVFDSDNRERETDMIIAAEFIKPQHISRMRNDAGGLICTAISHEEARKLRLPFMTDVMEAAQDKYSLLAELSPNDIPYDERSAFSLTINHRRTFTGITDNDRALTIKELAMLCKNGDHNNFGKHFRAPGHVTILRGSKGLLTGRQGHTEMSIALTEITGLTPAAVCCEMMDDNTGNSLPRSEVEKYAEKEGLLFLSGEEVIKAYKDFKG
ncbi:MAG: 3,4-dihydroxy-2-butanone-4-phosphate synthase [Methanobacteriaceae archaeon]|jgi:3,4-dihydroxy 2-butanone 4-phosphate synthase